MYQSDSRFTLHERRLKDPGKKKEFEIPSSKAVCNAVSFDAHKIVLGGEKDKEGEEEKEGGGRYGEEKEGGWGGGGERRERRGREKRRRKEGEKEKEERLKRGIREILCKGGQPVQCW